MGAHNVDQDFDERKLQAFMGAVLEDLRALDYMIDHGLIESGVHRMGAEQEMFLVDRNLRPAPIAVELLDGFDDSRLTTEIARFNLEANLTPQLIGGNCLTRMEQELNELLGKTRARAAQFGADVLLAGILPTLRPSDLTLDNLSPNPRYHELNRAVTKLRGGPFSIHIKGLDELQIEHDNMMMESCNTSFQIHFQVGPKEFARAYNAAQAITAPVLAAAVNSPILFGKRLWQETRLALFQHSADERSRLLQARSQPTRVGFGERWLKSSVLELLHDQLTRFRPIMLALPEDNSWQVLARGEVPPLSALFMHNGTVWPWNRACYGVVNGVAHLRIENRVLPAGPTVVDEVANAAFFIGLMLALPQEYGDIAALLDFDDAKSNFFAAARYDLQAQLTWIDKKTISAAALVRDQLLPLARQGLQSAKVESADIDRYLGVVDERVRTRQTGSRWILKSLAATDDLDSKHLRYHDLSERMLQEQKEGNPVHQWEVMSPAEAADWSQSYQTVEQFMSTDLFTVRPDDLVDLAASVMDWRHIRHVPVEDGEGHLVGLITHRGLLRLFGTGIHAVRNGRIGETRSPVTVREIMVANPITISPNTSSLEAIEIMRKNRIGCLPVVEGGHLVGIVTSFDFLEASAQLFQQHLSGDSRLSE